MADETSMSPAADTPSVEAPAAPKEKKTRALRKPKAASEAVVAASVSAPVKKTRGPGKKKPVASEAPVAKAPAASKKPAAIANAEPAKRGPRKVDAAPAPIDGFSELLKLEEENQKLRKALSEKLRAENAELRKKLGTA